MARSDPRSMATGVDRSLKRDLGATRVSATPVDVRTSRLELDDALRAEIPRRLGRRIERYALHITRATVRFRDVNGPRGGVDTVCRIKLSVSGSGHIVVEARAADAREAFRVASRSAATALRRELDREGPRSGRHLVGRAQPRPRRTRAARRSPAKRKSNMKARAPRATASFEVSAKPRPSRKSTRKSANRAKSGSKLQRRAKRALSSPRARASRS